MLGLYLSVLWEQALRCQVEPCDLHRDPGLISFRRFLNPDDDAFAFESRVCRGAVHDEVNNHPRAQFGRKIRVNKSSISADVAQKASFDFRAAIGGYTD